MLGMHPQLRGWPRRPEPARGDHRGLSRPGSPRPFLFFWEAGQKFFFLIFTGRFQIRGGGEKKNREFWEAKRGERGLGRVARAT